jgi:O-antigen ligase
LLVVLLAGEAMARSRAGLGLTIVALFGAFALGLSDRRVGTGFTPNKILGGATILAVILAVSYALYRILERFEADPLDDARLAFTPTTMEAAKAYLPLGSGLGTFVPVYASFEKPEDTGINTYANHAHNDAAELFLEAGVLGFVLAVLFVSWLIWRAIVVWRTAPPVDAREVDWSLARAATVIIALILVHSFFDYPLRTGAIMAIMAFSCALLIEPIAATEPVVEVAEASKKTRHRRQPKLSPVPALPPVPSGGYAVSEIPDRPSAGERWGSDIQWPEEWRKDSTAKQPS